MCGQKGETETGNTRRNCFMMSDLLYIRYPHKKKEYKDLRPFRF